MTENPFWTPGNVPRNLFQQDQKNAYDAAAASRRSARRHIVAQEAAAEAANRQSIEKSYSKPVSSSNSYSGPITKPVPLLSRIRTLLSAVILLFVWWLGFSDPGTHPYDHFLWSWGFPDTNPYGYMVAGYPYDDYIMWGSLALGVVQFLRIFRSRYA